MGKPGDRVLRGRRTLSQNVKIVGHGVPRVLQGSNSVSTGDGEGVRAGAGARADRNVPACGQEGAPRTTAAPGPLVRGKGGANVHKLKPMSPPPAPNRRVRGWTGVGHGEPGRAVDACSGQPESREAPAWFRASEGDRCPPGEGPRGRRSSTSGEKGKRSRSVWPSRHAQRVVYNPFRAAFAGSLSSVYASFTRRLSGRSLVCTPLRGIRNRRPFGAARPPTAALTSRWAARAVAAEEGDASVAPRGGPTFTGARRTLPIREHVSHVGFHLRLYTVPRCCGK